MANCLGMTLDCKAGLPGQDRTLAQHGGADQGDDQAYRENFKESHEQAQGYFTVLFFHGFPVPIPHCDHPAARSFGAGSSHFTIVAKGLLVLPAWRRNRSCRLPGSLDDHPRRYWRSSPGRKLYFADGNQFDCKLMRIFMICHINVRLRAICGLGSEPRCGRS